MSRPRVLVLGNTTADHVFRIHGRSSPDTKVQGERYDLFAGGQAANVAATLAFLDFDVWFVGAFGDDEGARIGREALSRAGVNLHLSKTVPGCPHHTAFILVAEDERTIVMHRDPRLALNDVAIPEAAVAGCAAVYTDGHEGEASLRLAKLAIATGTPLVLDIEAANSDTEQLAKFATHLVGPAAVLQELTGEKAVENAVRLLSRQGPAVVVATLGARGSVGCESPAEKIIRIPAAACSPVDTTGAGDAYHAGYLAALVQRKNLIGRMHFASALAAAKCEVAGPRLSEAASLAFRS